MLALEASMFFWSFLGIHLVGFASAWTARLITGARRQAIAQAMFYLLLSGVGYTTVVAWQFGAGYWLASGATLSTMVLIAITDFTHWRSGMAYV